MSSPQTPQPTSPLPGDDRPVVATGTDQPQLSLEERVQLFWLENKSTILTTCVLVLLILVAKECWLYYRAQREQAIGAAYASAESNSDKLKAFAIANPSHQLAGLAWLGIGDEAFKANKFAEATAAYEKAEPLVADGAFAGRAQIGRAFSFSLGGDKAKAEAAFKAIMADEKQSGATRTEARYHLALLAVEAGRVEEARKMITEVQQNDATGAWAQRAMVLLANLPPETVAGAAPTTDPVSEIKLNLPGVK